MFAKNVSEVLVHGARAEGSNWSKVRLFRPQGVRDVAAPLPLTSLADDFGAAEWTLERTGGRRC